jgi:hypothetical protein
MAVAVRAAGNDSFEFSKPAPLFTFTAGTIYGLDRGFDVSRDGERFLFRDGPTRTPPSGSSVELVVVQNWADELRRLVPPES